jgi:hypothetical protein
MGFVNDSKIKCVLWERAHAADTYAITGNLNLDIEPVRLDGRMKIIKKMNLPDERARVFVRCARIQCVAWKSKTFPLARKLLPCAFKKLWIIERR